MPATISTDVAGTILAKVIETGIIAYQYDEVTAIPFFRYKDLSGSNAPAAGFPRYTKNAYGTVATETTALATTAMVTTNVDVTVGRVGLARELSTTVAEDSIIGQALYVNEFVQDAARLYGEQLDTDATALFSSVTASVGTTATALSIATLVAGMSSQRVNKAKGAQVIHLHDLMLKQLQVAQAAATSTPWATFFQPNADSTAFGGYFMGAPVWASSKNPTANAAADRVGCIWSQNSSQYCAFAYVSKRMPSSLTETNILSDSNVWASFARHGVGIVANNFATKIISQNS